jgi:glycosyltransferase involved in cell wall biosynthesis
MNHAPLPTLRPKISVVIPHYNRGAYVEETLDSVLSQEGEFELVEVIVVDDHSDDPASVETLQRIALQDLVRVLRNDGPRGPSAPRNVGVRAARGDWIAFIDSDDVWLPGSLAARVEIARSEPSAEWISGDYCYWYGGDRREKTSVILGCSCNGPLIQRAERNGRICLRRPVAEFIEGNPSWTGTTLVRRELVLDAGGFDEMLIQAEDRDLWMRLGLDADLWFVPEVIALARRHETNITNRPDPPNLWNLRAYRQRSADPRFARYRAVLRTKMSQFYKQQARCFRDRREFLHAMRAYAGAITTNVRDMEAWRGIVASAIRRC